MMLRQCKTCNVVKPLDVAHYYHRPSRNYFSPVCIECSRASQNARYANDKEFRERIKARASTPERRARKKTLSRERWANDPDYRDAHNTKRRERRANNPEYRAAQNAGCREKYASSHTERECTRCRQRKPNDAFPKQIGVQICYACRENPPNKRVCSVCAESKSVEEFEKGRGRNQCKKCRKALHQQRISQRAGSEWECSLCNRVKPASEFFPGRRVCKGCTSGNIRDRRLNDPVWADSERENSRQYYANHIERAREYGIDRWEHTPRPCKLCGKEKMPRAFVRNRQICLDCSSASVRRCPLCGEDKPAGEFQVDKYSFSCRECRNAQAQGWRAANPERVKKTQRKHRSKPGYRQKVNVSKKRRYQRVPDYAEQERERARRRRAQTAGSPVGDIPSGHKEALIEAQGGRCAYCRERFGDTTLNRPHLDHYVPLAKAGPHSIDNLKLVLCAKCNVRKGDKDPHNFVQESLGQLFDLAIIPTVPVKLGSAPGP